MAQEQQQNKQSSETDLAKQKNGRLKMLFILAICIAPVVASYFTYYVIKPSGRTNYGALLDAARYPMPQLGSTTLDGKAEGLDAYKGKWVMLYTHNSACDKACADNLLDMRQVRLMQGKEMDRIERVWLITDDQPLDTVLMRENDGLHMLRAKAEAVNAWLPPEAGGTVSDTIYMIDPLGNLMMRFPNRQHAEDQKKHPYQMKKDITKLLTASSIG